MTKTTNYQKQKTDFLDSLQPDDFRNAASFNFTEVVIDQLLRNAISCKEDREEFIKKSVNHIFRENSQVADKITNLVRLYLEENEVD